MVHMNLSTLMKVTGTFILNGRKNMTQNSTVQSLTSKPHHMKNKTYHNGTAVTSLQENANFRKAKDILQREGRMKTLSNFGPYFPNKASRIHRVIETFTLEGMEFTIIESEAMYFSLGSMAMSPPRMEREAWYQPSLNC
jgi:hypothetical protein